MRDLEHSNQVHEQNDEPEQLIDGLFDVMVEFPNDWLQLILHDVELSIEGFIDVIYEHPRFDEIANKITQSR